MTLNKTCNLLTIIGNKAATVTQVLDGKVTITSNDNRFRLELSVSEFNINYPNFETRNT